MSISISKRHWYLVVAVGLVCAGFTLPAAARSVECPKPHAVSGPGVLKESAAQIATAGRFLASGDAAGRAPEIASDLRKKYPGVSNSEIENYLIAAYCPVVARLNGLSVAERQARVDRFAHQARVLDTRPPTSTRPQG